MTDELRIDRDDHGKITRVRGQFTLPAGSLPGLDAETLADPVIQPPSGIITETHPDGSSVVVFGPPAIIPWSRNPATTPTPPVDLAEVFRIGRESGEPIEDWCHRMNTDDTPEAVAYRERLAAWRAMSEEDERKEEEEEEEDE